MKTFKLFPLVGILIGSFSSAANALVIDRFNDDSSQKITVGPTTSNFNNPANVTNPDNTNLINAIRTISVTGVTGLSGSRSAYSYIEAGSFIVDNSAGVDSTVTLSYTFNPTDFTVNSSTRIAMTVDSDTTPTVLMSLITSSGTKSMATAQTIPGAGYFYIPYTLFSVGSGDLTQVTGLTMTFNGGVSWDASFTLMETAAPEIDAISGTGALTLMAGALALAGERRRRRS